MRIPEYIVSDLKDLGRNHLMALGFGLAGFTVAFCVNKACRWFFQIPASEVATKRSVFIELIATGLGLQACFSLVNRVAIFRNDSYTVNHRILILHVAAFALASLYDPRKIVCAGIGLSVASICLTPVSMGAVGAVFGIVGTELKEYLNFS